MTYFLRTNFEFIVSHIWYRILYTFFSLNFDDLVSNILITPSPIPVNGPSYVTVRPYIIYRYMSENLFLAQDHHRIISKYYIGSKFIVFRFTISNFIWSKYVISRFIDSRFMVTKILNIDSRFIDSIRVMAIPDFIESRIMAIQINKDSIILGFE